MADHESLRRYVRRLDPDTRSQLIADSAWLSDSEAIARRDGSQISIAVVADLMDVFEAKMDHWSDPSTSDRWLAPRLHFALRLTRAEASDPDLWAWLAVRFHWYVEWRWNGRKGIAENRWRGEVHKQAFARLWWGGELFRNGGDYRPVERAFIFQDFPNSYLHRPVTRCRSLALGLLDVVAPSDNGGGGSSGEVNDLARVLNLLTAGAPPEVLTNYQRDDLRNLQAWIREGATSPSDWDSIPDGPPCLDSSTASLSGGRALAERGRHLAQSAADRHKSGPPQQSAPSVRGREPAASQ